MICANPRGVYSVKGDIRLSTGRHYIRFSFDSKAARKALRKIFPPRSEGYPTADPAHRFSDDVLLYTGLHKVMLHMGGERPDYVGLAEDGRSLVDFAAILMGLGAVHGLSEPTEESPLRFGFVPCLRCAACRAMYAMTWRTRLMNEYSMTPDGQFITKTYSDNFLPKNFAGDFHVARTSALIDSLSSSSASDFSEEVPDWIRFGYMPKEELCRLQSNDSVARYKAAFDYREACDSAISDAKSPPVYEPPYDLADLYGDKYDLKASRIEANFTASIKYFGDKAFRPASTSVSFADSISADSADDPDSELYYVYPHSASDPYYDYTLDSLEFDRLQGSPLADFSADILEAMGAISYSLPSQLEPVTYGYDSVPAVFDTPKEYVATDFYRQFEPYNQLDPATYYMNNSAKQFEFSTYGRFRAHCKIENIATYHNCFYLNGDSRGSSISRVSELPHYDSLVDFPLPGTLNYCANVPDVPDSADVDVSRLHLDGDVPSDSDMHYEDIVEPDSDGMSRVNANEYAYADSVSRALSLNVRYTLSIRDVQNFIKRLRKYISKHYAKHGYVFPPKIKYFAAGEYGPRTNRPHYHIVIIGFSFKDLKPARMSGSNQLFTSEALSKLWPLGNVFVGAITPKSIAYTAGYTGKKLYGDRSSSHYFGRTPEFLLCSQGIGRSYFDKYQQDILVNDGMMLRVGKDSSLQKVPIPRAYLKWFEATSDSSSSKYWENYDVYLERCRAKSSEQFLKDIAYSNGKYQPHRLEAATSIMEKRNADFECRNLTSKRLIIH